MSAVHEMLDDLLHDRSVRSRFLDDVTMGEPRPGTIQWLRARIDAIVAAARDEAGMTVEMFPDGQKGVCVPDQDPTTPDTERLRALEAALDASSRAWHVEMHHQDSWTDCRLSSCAKDRALLAGEVVR